jgi:hypothetical protein
MKYAAETGSGARMYMLSFIKISSGVHKLTSGIPRRIGIKEVA